MTRACKSLYLVPKPESQKNAAFKWSWGRFEHDEGIQPKKQTKHIGIGVAPKSSFLQWQFCASENS